MYLQVFQHADLVARAERQQMRTIAGAGQARRHPRSARPRAGLQRRRRLDLRRAVGDRGRRRGAPPRCAARSATARPRSARRWPSGSAASARSRTSGGRSRPSRARRVAALEPRRRRLHQGEPPLLSEQGARGAPARLRRARQRRPGRPRVGLRPADPRQGRARSSSRPTRGATRSAALERPPTAGATVELTIDEYLQHIAERELHAGVVENRAAGGTRDHHGPAHRRDPRDGERADVQPERVPRVRRGRAAQPRRAGPLRAGLDLQDRDGVGGDRREGACRRRR